MNTLPLTHHINLAPSVTPTLRWDGVTSLESHRAACTAKLTELLGLHTFVPCEPVFEITAEDEISGLRHIHFILQTEEGYFTHCDLLLPKHQEGQLPLCVCLQGHSKGAHISLGLTRFPGDEVNFINDDGDYCIRAVKEGFAALAIEQRGFGQCGGTEYGPACERAAMTALILGRTLVGERVWDVMRVLDAMEAHFGNLITLRGSVLMGHSGGGTATYYTACLEHRFDAYLSSCAVCSYQESIINIHHCTCNYIPGIARYFDMGDLAVMIAPKKLVILCGNEDDIFPIQGFHKVYATIETLYNAVGATYNCALVMGVGGHRFYADDAWPVVKDLLSK